jgi:hypothetical protein
MKRIQAVYLPTLDVLDISSVSFLLERQAPRDYISCINWEEFPYRPIAAFNVAYSKQYLFIHYYVRGLSLRAAHREDGSPVYEDSCVEFFCKNMNSRTYMNFEFNCAGVCDAAKRLSRDSKTSLDAASYNAIMRYSSINTPPDTELLDIRDWCLTVAIPFYLLDLDGDNLPEKIWANFYKCGDKTSIPHYLSWNPIHTTYPDFHRPEFFGELYF